jgi:hypothetical protein
MPISANYIVSKRNIPKYHPVPADKYQVQITDINLIENEVNPFSGKEEDRLNFEFTILDNKNFDYKNEEGETEIESTRGRKLWKRISPSNSPATKKSKASWLYKILCAVEGKELSESELQDIAPATLIGQQLIVMVEETEKGYNNVLSFGATKEELEPVPVKETMEEVSEEDLENIVKTVDPGVVDGVKKK